MGNLWAKMHGGVTHFPIALLFASFVFDLVGYLLNRDPHSRDLEAAGFYAIVLAALASFGAVATGLLLTHWNLWGTDKLLAHHEFAYPSFALTIGLAVWRILVRNKTTRIGFGIYLVVAAVTTILMLVTGYWGGEMIIS